MLRLWLLSVSLMVLAWTINSVIPPRHLQDPPQAAIVNFDHTVYFDPVKMRSPSTKEEIVQIVLEAIEHGRHIRVVGSGHSRSKIASCDDVMISLHRYRGVFKFDEHSKQVTVKAGTTLGEVVEYLDKKRLALSSLPAITEQSIAGAISTGTHGTGVEFGNLATMVTRLELITGEGETLSLSPTNHPAIFKAALVSFGMLGVITKVTLQCVPAFNLEESLEPLTLDQCVDHLPTLASSAEHVKLWTELYSGRCAVIRMNRTTKEITRGNSMKVLDWKMRIMEPFLFLSSWLPSYTPDIMRFIVEYIDIFPSYSRVAKSYKVFVPPPYFPSNQQTEVAVAMDKCVDALRLLQQTVYNHSLPVNLIAEVRFVAKDDILLSPNNRRHSCHLTLMLYNPSRQLVVSYFDMFYRELVRLNFNPRVHFGKYFNVNPREMAESFPQFDDFMNMRETLDPSEMFLNHLMRKSFVS